MALIELVSLADSWKALREADPGLFSERDVDSLRDRIGTIAKCALIEREYICKDYRNVYSAYYSKKFTVSSARTTRVHFFDVELGEEAIDFDENRSSFSQRLKEAARAQNRQVDSEVPTTAGYIGFVVSRPTEGSRIGRTVLEPRKCSLKTGSPSGYACAATYRVNLFGDELKVSGFPHQSQDAEVHLCAQTATWALFRYLSQRYVHYPERYPHDVAMLNRDLRGGRRLPGRGLFMNQVAAMFGEFGLGAEMYQKIDRPVWPDPDREEPGWAAPEWLGTDDAMSRLIHVYTESGMPPVIGILSPDHAVVVVGYTESTRRQVDRPGIVIPSSDFVTELMVNDDNYAPYSIVGRASPGELVLAPTYGWTNVDTAIIPLPDKIFLTAEHAEIIVAAIFEALGPPVPLEGSEPQFVSRLFATSSKNYKEFRRKHRDSAFDFLVQYPLPHFIWVCELYTLDGWTRRAAIAEVVLDATAGHNDAEPFLWIRYPQFMAVNRARIVGDGEEPIEWWEPEDVPDLEGFVGNLRRVI